MEVNSKIRAQIEEEFGKLVYSYTTHQYCSNYYLKLDKTLKISEIILSSSITCGIVSNLISYQLICTIITSIISLALVIVASISKAGDYQLKAVKHTQTALDLWEIREKYISLLTEFDLLSEKNQMMRRDDLLSITKTIYSYEERTNDKAYKRAQNALKNEEYQYFTRKELNVILPSHLRHEFVDEN